MTAEIIVQMDVFPAKVMLPSGQTIEPVRATIADDTLQIWQDTNNGHEVYFQRQVLSTDGTVTNGLGVQVEDGTVLVGRAAGCGCGARLRYADLWPDRVRINTML